MKTRLLLFSLCIITVISCTGKSSDESKSITLYTHRHYDTDQAIIKEFEKETGIKINVVNASADELIQKMEAEGEQSPADLLFTVDAGRLVRAKEKGILQSVTSDFIDKYVPKYLKDDNNHWFGITKRARVIVYDKNDVDSSDLSTYAALTDPKWTGSVLIRSSGNIYNQSLMASIIANEGEEMATEWAEGIIKNFARSPQGNDRDQVKGILAGDGEVAIINTYYLGHLLNSSDPEEVSAGEAVNVFFPNQAGRGSHINVSGIGVAKYSSKKELAIQFIEYLLSKKTQELFASSNYEYPVNPDANISELLQSWGSFKEDSLALQKLGELNKDAVVIFDKVGWP